MEHIRRANVHVGSICLGLAGYHPGMDPAELSDIARPVNDPHEYTEDEVRELFLKQVWAMTNFWATQVPEQSAKERIEGVAFSIMSLLDGCSAAMGGFIVAPCPHPEDKAYLQSNSENWYPENHESDVNCDISGSLHELFHDVGRRMGYIE